MTQRKSLSAPFLLLVGATCLAVIVIVAVSLSLITKKQSASEQTQRGDSVPTEIESEDSVPWKRISDSPFLGRSEAVALWTGTEMLIWGGHEVVPGDPPRMTDSKLDGLAYNPKTDTWRAIPAGPLEPRDRYFSTVWTGSEMIVWGGYGASPGNGELNDGAAYHPTSNQWRQLSRSPLKPRLNHVGVWTGKEMLIFGGEIWESHSLSDGASYDPTNDSWARLPSSPDPVFRNGDALVVEDKTFILNLGLAYEIETRRWRRITKPKPNGYGRHFQTFWNEGEAFMWGLSCNAQGCEEPGTKGFIFNPSENAWRDMSPSGLPFATYAGVWTGQQLMVWGGSPSYRDLNAVEIPGFSGGGSFNPISNEWEALPNSPFNSQGNPLAVWTGSEMIVVDGTQAAAYKPQ